MELKRGAGVYGPDGKKVLIDAESDRITHFVISEGLILKQRKLIPAHWVGSILADRIFLTVPSRIVEDLPDYEEAA